MLYFGADQCQVVLIGKEFRKRRSRVFTLILF